MSNDLPRTLCRVPIRMGSYIRLDDAMSRPMTMGELNSLLLHISECHSFCRNTHGRFVKYVDPKIDTRDWKCFAICFRTSGEPVTFHTQNECRDLPETLLERCMAWLDEEPYK